MKVGLKTVITEAAHLAGTGTERFRGHHRRLIASGRLARRPGKGPGSGVEATPQNIALFFLTFAAEQSATDLAKMAAAATDKTRPQRRP